MDYMDIVFECKIEKRYTKTISINNPYDITIIHWSLTPHGGPLLTVNYSEFEFTVLPLEIKIIFVKIIFLEFIFLQLVFYSP